MFSTKYVRNSGNTTQKEEKVSKTSQTFAFFDFFKGVEKFQLDLFFKPLVVFQNFQIGKTT